MQFIDWLSTNVSALEGAGGLIAIVLFFWAIIKWPFSKTTTDDSGEVPRQGIVNTVQVNTPAPAFSDGQTRLTIEEFQRLRRETKAELEQELAQAHESEKDQLRQRIAELERQIDEPEKALAELRARIKELEDLLDREGNHIGGDRIAEAKAAMEAWDFSVADDIFAEIEAQNVLAVKESARAAYGRGEIAEAEIRWADAARHYARAAQLDESFDTLKKAREFAWRAGEVQNALTLGAALVRVAEAQDDLQKQAIA